MNKISVTVLLSVFMLLVSGCAVETIEHEDPLTEEEARNLLIDTQQKLVHIYSRAEKDHINHEYLILIEDQISTREKLDAYFQDVYTEEAKQELYDMMRVEERDGMLLIAVADFIFRGWLGVEVQQIEYDGDLAFVTVILPNYAVGEVELTVQLKYVSGKWYVDQPIW
jgi:hypothetical protein